MFTILSFFLLNLVEVPRLGYGMTSPIHPHAGPIGPGAEGMEDLGRLDSKLFRKVVVIPDVHGDMEALIEALFIGLKKGETVPSRITLTEFGDTFSDALGFDCRVGRRAGVELPAITKDPSIALIQLGDLVDRGPFSIECIRIIQSVPTVLGWTVRTLYGNHELFNMAGEGGVRVPRVVGDAAVKGEIHIEDLGGFPNMGARLNAMLPQGALPFSDDGLTRLDGGPALSEPGQYNKLLTNSFVAMVRLAGPDGDQSTCTLFVHGGVDKAWLVEKELLKEGLRGDDLVHRVNEYFKSMVRTPEGTLDLLQTYGSPIWSRQLAHVSPLIRGDTSTLKPVLQCKRSSEAMLPLDDPTEDMNDILNLFQVGRIIVGHTPQADRRMKGRCGGKVILADIAMSKWMTRKESGIRKPVAVLLETVPMQRIRVHVYEAGTIKDEYLLDPGF